MSTLRPPRVLFRTYTPFDRLHPHGANPSGTSSRSFFICGRLSLHNATHKRTEPFCGKSRKYLIGGYLSSCAAHLGSDTTRWRLKLTSSKFRQTSMQPKYLKTAWYWADRPWPVSCPAPLGTYRGFVNQSPFGDCLETRRPVDESRKQLRSNPCGIARSQPR